jgi:hypothetical protein
VTPVDKGSPETLVKVPPDGVPNAPPFTTAAPAEPTFTARAVATPVPNAVMPVPPLATGRVPVTPLVKGKPVALVKTAAEGVPRLGVVKDKLAANFAVVTIASPRSAVINGTGVGVFPM